MAALTLDDIAVGTQLRLTSEEDHHDYRKFKLPIGATGTITGIMSVRHVRVLWDHGQRDGERWATERWYDLQDFELANAASYQGYAADLAQHFLAP